MFYEIVFREKLLQHIEKDCGIQLRTLSTDLFRVFLNSFRDSPNHPNPGLPKEASKI